MFKHRFLVAALLAAVCLGSITRVSHADPVDLRGKKGVVDPADLKKFDPAPKGLKIKEPPAPSR